MTGQIKAICPGTCPDCGDLWQPGDPIRLGVGNEPGFWRHDVCPALLNPTEGDNDEPA